MSRRALWLLLCAGRAWADGPLVVVGGGERPRAAMERFVEWAGGPQARILVVPWASGEPAASYGGVRRDLEPLGPAAIDPAPFAPLDGEARARFLMLLEGASGVFFGGGDQSRIMDVLADPELLDAVRARHRAGVVFGGTSAGAAAMSRIMITGDGDFTRIDAARVVTREGLGLIPRVIVDQHFLRRSRHNRLFALVLAHPRELGVGIDEDAAILVRDGEAEVVGGPVVLVDGVEKPGALVMRLVPPGGSFALPR
jgi:cyanophycinase